MSDEELPISPVTEVWHPIETAPKNNTAFDVMAVAPDGTVVIITNCRYVRNFNKWEIRGTQNKVSSYFTLMRWRAIAPPENTNP